MNELVRRVLSRKVSDSRNDSSSVGRLDRESLFLGRQKRKEERKKGRKEEGRRGKEGGREGRKKKRKRGGEVVRTRAPKKIPGGTNNQICERSDANLSGEARAKRRTVGAPARL